MALNYRTYYAIPNLKTYAEAKAHYDKVRPIRGDKHGTRPCGRRNQKWFSIWMDEQTKDIHVGYGSQEPKERQTLVSYHPSGTITVSKRNRWSCASDNERLQRLLGTDFRTHQYDAWVRCAWYDGETKRKGYLPLHCNAERDWHATPAQSTFVRDAAGDLVFLNYRYPVIHKPNRVKLKEALAPYQSFFTFVGGILKLQGGTSLRFAPETQAEFFGWSGKNDYRGQPVPNAIAHLRWGYKVNEHRAQFLAWATSDNLDDRMKAAISLSRHTSGAAREFFIDMLMRMHHDTLLDAEVITTGALVRDRYKQYLRD